MTATAGQVRIEESRRDRSSTFEPVIVPKGQRRIGQADDMILSLYARGMTTRDIQAHLAEVYGAEVPPALISRVTGVVAEEITAWQTRPVDAFLLHPRRPTVVVYVTFNPHQTRYTSPSDLRHTFGARGLALGQRILTRECQNVCTRVPLRPSDRCRWSCRERSQSSVALAPSEGRERSERTNTRMVPSWAGASTRQDCGAGFLRPGVRRRVPD